MGGRKKTSLNFNTKNKEMHFRPVVAEDKTPQSQYDDTEREILALTTPARQCRPPKITQGVTPTTLAQNCIPMSHERANAAGHSLGCSSGILRGPGRGWGRGWGRG